MDLVTCRRHWAILWHCGFANLEAEGGLAAPAAPVWALGDLRLCWAATLPLWLTQIRAWGRAGAGVGQWLRSQPACHQALSPAQNLLGLQGIPRQFFLQVYETLRRIGETRSAPSLPCSVPCSCSILGSASLPFSLATPWTDFCVSVTQPPCPGALWELSLSPQPVWGGTAVPLAGLGTLCWG